MQMVLAHPPTPPQLAPCTLPSSLTSLCAAQYPHTHTSTVTQQCHYSTLLLPLPNAAPCKWCWPILPLHHNSLHAPFHLHSHHCVQHSIHTHTLALSLNSATTLLYYCHCPTLRHANGAGPSSHSTTTRSMHPSIFTHITVCSTVSTHTH